MWLCDHLQMWGAGGGGKQGIKHCTYTLCHLIILRWPGSLEAASLCSGVETLLGCCSTAHALPACAEKLACPLGRAAMYRMCSSQRSAWMPWHVAHWHVKGLGRFKS
jgi:hypothetical protein